MKKGKRRKIYAVYAWIMVRDKYGEGKDYIRSWIKMRDVKEREKENERNQDGCVYVRVSDNLCVTGSWISFLKHHLKNSRGKPISLHWVVNLLVWDIKP